jgi:hypothetical protein
VEVCVHQIKLPASVCLRVLLASQQLGSASLRVGAVRESMKTSAFFIFRLGARPHSTCGAIANVRLGLPLSTCGAMPSSILGLPAIIVVAGNAINLCHRLGAMPLSTCGAMQPSFLACPHAGTPVACSQGASIPVAVTAAGSTRGAVALLFLASSTLGVAGNAIDLCHRLGAMPLPTCGAMPSSTFGIPIPMGLPTAGAVPPSTFRASTEHRGAVPPSAVAFNLLCSCSVLSYCDILPTRTPVGS